METTSFRLCESMSFNQGGLNWKSKLNWTNEAKLYTGNTDAFTNFVFDQSNLF